MKKIVLRWAAEAKDVLTALGVHIREVVREAHSLIQATNQSRVTIAALRERIHSKLKDVYDCRMSLKDADSLAQHAETVALSIVIEANRSQGSKNLALMAEGLHQTALKLKKLTHRNYDAISQLEVELEPWSTDADLAFHAYDDIYRATESMKSHLKGTTDSILSKAKLIQALRKEIESGSAQAIEAPRKTAG